MVSNIVADKKKMYRSTMQKDIGFLIESPLNIKWKYQSHNKVNPIDLKKKWNKKLDYKM